MSADATSVFRPFAAQMTASLGRVSAAPPLPGTETRPVIDCGSGFGTIVSGKLATVLSERSAAWRMYRPAGIRSLVHTRMPANRPGVASVSSAPLSVTELVVALG